MNVLLTSNIFSSVKLIVCLFIAIRAFALYIKAPKPRLFILGTAIAVAGVTAIVELMGDNGVMGMHSYTTQWFTDIGLVVSYGFIFLGALGDSSAYLRQVMIWQLILVGLLFLLVLLIPVLPTHPIPTVQFALGICRATMCFGVFALYTVFFVRKASRFSLLMALAFLLFMLGNTIILPQYLAGNFSTLVFSGNLLRTAGYFVLFAAFWLS